MELERQAHHRLAAEFAALPTAAGGVITLFFAFRPEELPSVYPYLYGLSLLPFLLLFGMSIYATHQYLPARMEAKIAREQVPSTELNDADYYPVEEWLKSKIIMWRIGAVLNRKRSAEYSLYLGRIRIVFSLLVVYLVLVTVAALLATS